MQGGGPQDASFTEGPTGGGLRAASMAEARTLEDTTASTPGKAQRIGGETAQVAMQLLKRPHSDFHNGPFVENRNTAFSRITPVFRARVSSPLQVDLIGGERTSSAAHDMQDGQCGDVLERSAFAAVGSSAVVALSSSAAACGENRSGQPCAVARRGRRTRLEGGFPGSRAHRPAA